MNYNSAIFALPLRERPLASKIPSSALLRCMHSVILRSYNFVGMCCLSTKGTCGGILSCIHFKNVFFASVSSHDVVPIAGPLPSTETKLCLLCFTSVLPAFSQSGLAQSEPFETDKTQNSTPGTAHRMPDISLGNVRSDICVPLIKKFFRACPTYL